jgi:hypothetical protein
MLAHKGFDMLRGRFAALVMAMVMGGVQLASGDPGKHEQTLVMESRAGRGYHGEQPT